MDDDGIERSAILLMSLGEDEAAEVFKHLAPKEVQKIGTAMAAITGVGRERVAEVLSQFVEEAEAGRGLDVDATEYLKSVLRKALGDDRSAAVIEAIVQSGDISGIEGLKWMDAASVAELLKNEHPQIVAAILVHLDRDQACEILKGLTERLRADVILRIATLDGIQPMALRELNDTLARLLSVDGNIKKTQLGGVKVAAEIMNFMPTQLEGQVIESVKEFDSDLAQSIVDQMFVFENILALDDRAVQLLLREVQSESLIVALKGATPEMREKIFKNMSQRAAEMLREDLESKGPVKVSDVEQQQKEILKVVRRLSEEGQIALGGKGEESFV